MKKSIFWLASASLVLAGSSLGDTATLLFLDVQRQPVQELLAGDTAIVYVKGARPGSEVKIRCGRGPLVSEGHFVVDPEGSVDLSLQPSLRGTFTGIDPDGPWWSRVKSADPVGSPDSPFTCVAEEDGRFLAQGSLARYYAAPGVRSLDLVLDDEGFVGRYSAPAGRGPFPALLVLGGSEGGHDKQAADYFASQGYATLSLAYFREPGLPDSLNKIPLEYFESAIRWLQAQPETRESAMGVVGTSRGGELALLLASTFPVFRAVVSKVGSGLVWAGAWENGQQTSSWTYQGREIPAMPFTNSKPRYIDLPDGRRVQDVSEYFRQSLKALPYHPEARIPVERISSPILFLGGDDDRIWPSCELGRIAFARLQNRPYADRFVCYPEAGHWLSLPGYPTTDLVIQHPVFEQQQYFGGTAQGTARAQRNGQTELLSFLRENLGTN